MVKTELLPRNCAPIGVDWPAAALREATEAVGVSAAHAEVLRIGHCAVVMLPRAGLVARIGRPGYPLERLAAELRFALYVHEAGVPALRPAIEVADRPIPTSQGPVTFWPLLRAVAEQTDWVWLAGTLRRLHGLPLPAGVVSLWDPIARVETRLAAYGARPGARDEYISVLSAACTEAREVLGGLASWLGVRLIHGDPMNVIVTEDGPVLLDFDLSGVGPAEWDLVSIAVRHRRFGLSGRDIGVVSNAYGFDVRGWPHFQDLIRVRELLDCSFAMTIDRADPGARKELDLRMRAWLHPADRTRWTSLSASSHTVLS